MKAKRMKNVGNVYVDFERLAYDLVRDLIEQGVDDITLMEDRLNLSMMKQLKKELKRRLKMQAKILKDISHMVMDINLPMRSSRTISRIINQRNSIWLSEIHRP